MTTLGIDLGSRSVKVCRMEDGVIGALEVHDTMAFYRAFGAGIGEGFSVDFGLEKMSDHNLQSAIRNPQSAIHCVVATGYGRNAAAVTGASTVTELTAHMRGAVRLTGLETFTLLDMGGQDFKVVRIEGGAMADFATNDKCAASTGRYLENMARVLGITLEELGRCADDPAPLSDTCAIFGESEIIGLIVRGTPIPRLAAGVNAAVVRRVLPFLDRMGGDIIIMSGGVAMNGAVVSILRRETGREVVVCPEPQYAGAVGCCVPGRPEA